MRTTKEVSKSPLTGVQRLVTSKAHSPISGGQLHRVLAPPLRGFSPQAASAESTLYNGIGWDANRLCAASRSSRQGQETPKNNIQLLSEHIFLVPLLAYIGIPRKVAMRSPHAPPFWVVDLTER